MCSECRSIIIAFYRAFIIAYSRTISIAQYASTFAIARSSNRGSFVDIFICSEFRTIIVAYFRTISIV